MIKRKNYLTKKDINFLTEVKRELCIMQATIKYNSNSLAYINLFRSIEVSIFKNSKYYYLNDYNYFML